MSSLQQCQFIPTLLVGLGIIASAVTPLVRQPPALAQSAFYDVQGHWAKPCITRLAQQGIINGYPDGSFRPSLSMNRAEFATIVAQAFPKAARTRKPVNFVDVPTYHWAYNQITASCSNAIFIRLSWLYLQAQPKYSSRSSVGGIG